VAPYHRIKRMSYQGEMDQWIHFMQKTANSRCIEILLWGEKLIIDAFVYFFHFGSVFFLICLCIRWIYKWFRGVLIIEMWVWELVYKEHKIYLYWAVHILQVLRAFLCERKTETDRGSHEGHLLSLRELKEHYQNQFGYMETKICSYNKVDFEMLHGLFQVTICCLLVPAASWWCWRHQHFMSHSTKLK